MTGWVETVPSMVVKKVGRKDTKPALSREMGTSVVF